MRRFITIAILLLPALIACTDDSGTGSTGATGVVLSRDNVDLLVGETATLTATVLPESLGMGVEWSVLDEEYADVKDGVITAKAEGVTYVIATSADGRQKTACMVSVNPPIKYAVSIKDASNQLLDGIYGYPGMSVALSAVTSDDGIHSFTWSIEDEAAGSITQNGVLTLKAVASTDAGFYYDAQTFLKVVTEDGCGCKIPVRSSILAGLQVGGSFNPTGTPIIVQAAGSYPVAVMYQGPYGPVALPSDVVDIELDNSKDFSIQESDGGFTLTTGPSTGVSTSFSVSIGGSDEKLAIAQLKIDKIYLIKAQVANKTSCTLTFTWTEDISAEDDVSKPYKISLYRDEECADLVVSHSISANHSCWDGRQPRFIFCGLEPSTDYWFQVIDTTEGDVKDSPVINATTLPFTLVDASKVSNAQVGDVILGENFSETYGPDEWDKAVGFMASTKSLDPPSGENPDGSFEKYSSTGTRLWGNYVRMSEGRRLAAGWGFFGNSAVYSRSGYLRVATTSGRTHIVTPKLKGIPDGKKATLSVTVTALLHEKAGNEVAVFAESGLTMNSTTDISSASFCKYTGASLSNGYPLGLVDNSTAQKWYTATIEIPNVTNKDQLIVGSQNNVSGKNRFNIADITVTIIELN